MGKKSNRQIFIAVFGRTKLRRGVMYFINSHAFLEYLVGGVMPRARGLSFAKNLYRVELIITLSTYYFP